MLDILCALICVFLLDVFTYTSRRRGSQLGILSLLHYGYGVVQNKMIRDQNIVGMRMLSWQRSSSLTLTSLGGCKPLAMNKTMDWTMDMEMA